MDAKLFKAVQAKVPKVNKDVVHGIAYKQAAKAEEYMDEVWRSIASAFPENLKYIDYQRCTPEEEFNLLIKRYNSNEYQLDVSDIFIVKYLLDHTSASGDITRIEVPIALPYLHKGCQLRIKRTRYTVSPVLSSNVFQVESNSITVKLKMADSYVRRTHRFYLGDERVTASVVYSKLHRGVKKYKKNNAVDTKNSPRPEPALVFYLLIKYGLTGLFKKVGSAVIAGEHDSLKTLDSDKWIICSAHELKPPSVKRTKNYVDSQIKLAVDRESLNGPDKELIMSVIASFFYITDHFPDRIDLKYLEEPRLWKLLLGITYFGQPTNGEGVLIEQIDNHLNTLDEYIDITTKLLLKSDGIEVDNLYELFFVIMSRMQTMVWSMDPTSLYGKKLMTLPYLLKEITNGITNFMFKIIRLDRKMVSIEDIRSLIKKYVKMNAFFFNYDKHKEIDLITSPCDVFSFEHTTKMLPQQTITGKSSHTSGLNDPANLAHISIAEIGSYTNLHGADTTGRGYLNPFVDVAEDGTVNRSEKFRALTDYGQLKLRKQ